MTILSWNKHAKEEGYVVSDVQTINITIDDLINGNLRDMEITAQFGVYRQAVKGLDEQLQAKEQECERLKKVNRHIEHSRTQKADKLMRIEKLIIACSTGYTDEFIQELLVILHEPEPIKE